MKIYAHSLVKNEAKWLWYSISSIAPFVDKVMLWDTGSTDETIKVINELQKRFPGIIDFKIRPIQSLSDFELVRQEMLNETDSDWFIMVDGDEIWWRDSIVGLVDHINKVKNKSHYVVVPTYNLVGDIFHYQDQSSGGYKFKQYRGHFNLRAINRSIQGLKSLGNHGLWGWADDENNMVQESKQLKMSYLDSPYIHATNIVRSNDKTKDSDVLKRDRKLKHEIGKQFPLDFYYPEVFFEKSPSFIKSPWEKMSTSFKVRSYFETPFRRIKRMLFESKVGY